MREAYGTEHVNETLEERVTRLEAQISELKNLKMGPAGPRGPQGPIDACVAQAERMVESKLAEYVKRADDLVDRESQYRNESVESLRGELRQHSTQVADSLSVEGTRNRIEYLVVHILHDYGVVSSHDNRVIQAD